MSRKILIASLKHETNTFSKLPTDIAAYEARTLYRGQEVIDRHKGTRVEVAAFLDAAETYGWEIVTPISASATPSGRVTEEAFETFASEIMASLKDEGPFDAVLLALHGAMVTTHDEDGEGLFSLDSVTRQSRNRPGVLCPRDPPFGGHFKRRHSV